MSTINQQLLGSLIMAMITTTIHSALLFIGTGLAQTLSTNATLVLIALLYIGNVLGMIILIYINNRSHIKHP